MSWKTSTEHTTFEAHGQMSEDDIEMEPEEGGCDWL